MVTTIAAIVALVLLPAPTLGFNSADHHRTSKVTANGGRVVPSKVTAEPDAAERESREAFDSVVMKTYGRYPITMVSGNGVHLTDSQGKIYLDFVAGISTCALGHNHKGLSDAVSQQIKSLHHVSNLYYIPQQAELAKWLVQNSCADRVFFCNSGAEANEVGPSPLSRGLRHPGLSARTTPHPLLSS